jgi:SAM-dependent methyltransferase
MRRLILLRHKRVGCAKSRGKTVRRAQRRGAILRTQSAVPRAVAHPAPARFITVGAALVAALSLSWVPTRGAPIPTAAVAQELAAPSGVPAGAFPKPDRPVAGIVSPIWHDEKERDAAAEPAQLVRLLGIKSGMTVADIGAGSGYYVVRLSPIVAAGGRIIAEDVMPNYVQSLRKRVDDLGLQNVAIILGEPHDPKLPAGSADVAILVHMYHEIAQPYALLYNLVPALKPDARVGIVDAFGPISKHGTPPRLLRCELAAVGYRELSFQRLTGSNAYLASFKPPSVDSRTRPDAIVACKAR